VATRPTPQLDEPIDGPIDGRTARAVRTRDAIVDSCIALVEEGDLRPTAPKIADRAGVSVRSVFQHFDDLETLFAAVGSRVVSRLAALVAPIDPDRPLADRIDDFVLQRCRVNEAVSPIRRAALVHAPTSQVINAQFKGGHAYFRDQVTKVFAAEVAAAGPRGPALVDAVMTVASWSTWNVLRTLEGRSVDAATEGVGEMLALCLAGAGAHPA
jgi:TetR/AcrR family transcriptional regulator of autoinduction and epiphytic fitness